MDDTPESRIPTSGDPLSELPTGGASFQGRQIVANRYEILSRLGSGGMGEVWHAYDLKLRVDVALKSLRLDLQRNDDRTEALRREVRTAREVISPNVCRIFDLVVEEDRELISMEYIDGITLTALLVKKGSLELREARDIAAQFLAGLEAIHQAGLVHRDLKPENIMITRTGRVVVMDFGIAKQIAHVGGTISGTPPYMSPEQLAGDKVDARSDVFSAGVVLAEMIYPEGVYSQKTREVIWDAVRKRPLALPESAWKGVIARAVSETPENRFASAGGLARALEEVTHRVETIEERKPYPGLASFSAADVEYFFGRELEVEGVIKKLQQLHLMGLIGPSGAGKTSFLRAGLIPALPSNWNHVFCTPGDSPLINLGQALAPKLSSDVEAIQKLLRFEDPQIAIDVLDRWKKNHPEAVLIIDRFEELFTLNAPEVRSRYAEVVGRAAVEADVRVLLSMRDDFLLHCSDHPQLLPIFSELTPLTPLSGASLRRALVQPALKCNYRFEDETLIDQMLADVEQERGALPLMAFAAAKLWEKRDRETGQLTRAAYNEIGGVAGALAQHAEHTMERIGTERQPIVREIFRNLITAQNTRAARDTDDLLSVFPEKQAAEEVLRTLIDARLLTSFEAPQQEGEKQRSRVEIIHESLLSNWPRLVRWQTQDADSAQLRDQLRQAAQLWEQRSRSEDLLWTGAAFREYQLWRERYPGGLTTAEEAFAAAMANRATRRRRWRTIALSSVIIIAIAVAGITSWLWQRSEKSAQQASDEARRAEASKLLALAQARREEDPTQALAYTTASLELADTVEARLFALRLLQSGPMAVEVTGDGELGVRYPVFSPDGTHLVAAGFTDEIRVWSHKGGRPVILQGAKATTPAGGLRAEWASNEILVTGVRSRPVDAFVWNFPKLKRIRVIEFGGHAWWQVGLNAVFAEVGVDRSSFRLRAWPLPNGDVQDLGKVPGVSGFSGFLRNGTGWFYSKGDAVYLRKLTAGPNQQNLLLGRHQAEITHWKSLTNPAHLATVDRTGEIRVWDSTNRLSNPIRVIPKLNVDLEPRIPDQSFEWAANVLWADATPREAHLWNLREWPQARRLTLRRKGSWFGSWFGFHPKGDWIAISTHGYSRLTFWPLRGAWPTILTGYATLSRPLTFSPDGRWIATTQTGDAIQLWPVPRTGQNAVKTLLLPQAKGRVWFDIAFDPQGRFIFVVCDLGDAYMVPLDGSQPRRLEGFSSDTLLISIAVSPSGLLAAAAFGSGRTTSKDRILRVWNLKTGEARSFDLPEAEIRERPVESLAFVNETTLYTSGNGGIVRWNIESGTYQQVFEPRPEAPATWTAFGPRAQSALVLEPRPDTDTIESVKIIDLNSGKAKALPGLANSALRSTTLWPRSGFDFSGTVAAIGDRYGIVRVVDVLNGKPHLLVSHDGPIDHLAISPDGRWLATTGEDNTMRLWRMPNLKEQPFHNLSKDEFTTKLKRLTNIRIVRDPASAEGWKETLDDFPGWEKIPTW